MNYKRLTVKGIRHSNCCEAQKEFYSIYDRLSELEDLIEVAENGDAKKLKKENAIWAYEMTIRCLEADITTLKAQLSFITNKETETHFQSLDKDNRIKNLLSENEKLKQEIERLKKSNNIATVSTVEEEEQWWQK